MGADAPKCRCPGCGYDLAGLLEHDPLVCPECGGSFTLDELNRPPSRKRFDVSSLPWVFGGGMLLAVWVIWFGEYVPCALLFFAWPVVLIASVRDSRSGRGSPALTLVWACVLSIVGAVPGRWGKLTAENAMLANVVPLIILAIVCVIPPRRWYAAAIVMLALIPGVPALGLVGAAGAAYANGDYWTDWDRSFESLSDHYALGRDDAMREGLVLLAPAAALAGAAPFFRRRARAAPEAPVNP